MNDAQEQLEVAKEWTVELEAENENLRTTAAEDLRMIRKLEAERDALAAVIEQAKTWAGGHFEPRTNIRLILNSADTDAALREVRAAVREESAQIAIDYLSARAWLPEAGDLAAWIREGRDA